MGHSATVKVPRFVHHELEVVVSVDRHGDVVVVLEPLLHDDDTITAVGMTLDVREVILEGIEELSENIVLSLLATLNIGMLLGVVALADIVDINLARLILVQDGEGLLCDGDTSRVHLTDDTSEELIVGELTRAVTIEDGLGSDDLLLVETNTEVVHGLLELSDIKSLRAVVVSDLEFSSEGRDTTGASSLDLVLDVLNDGLLTGILGNTVGSRLGGISPTASSLLGSASLRSVEDVVVLLSSRLVGHISTPALLAHTDLRLFGELPGVLHHELEVHIVVDTDGDVVVVLIELLLGDNVVGGLVFTHGVSSLEGLKELLEDLLLGLLTRLDIRVVSGVVDITDVVDVNPAIAVLVELLEGLSGDSLAGRVHGTADSTEELAISALTIVIDIEVVEEDGDLALREVQLEIVHGLGELVLVEGLRVVIIHDLELSLEADDATGTAGSKLLLELQCESLRVLRGSLGLTTVLGGGSGLGSAEDGTRKLLVVDGTGAISIIEAEEHLEVLLNQNISVS